MTVTVYVPVASVELAQTVSEEVADPPDGTKTDVGLSVAVKPVFDVVAVRVTLPEKPLRLATVMMTLESQLPWASLGILVGVAVTLKSWTVSVAVAEPVTPAESVALTVTVKVPEVEYA